LPELFELEPEDIHMIKAQNSDPRYTTSKNLDARIALHRAYTPPGKDFLDFAWAHYDFSSVGHLLEVGCGSGAFWTHEARSLSGLINLVLTDKSRGMLDSARANLVEAGIKGNYHVSEVEKLPFESTTFDAALAQFMLYHAASKDGALQEIRRVLKDGGWAGVVLTQPGHMDEIFQVMRQLAPASIPVFDSDHFTSEDGASLLRTIFGEVQRYDYELQMRVTDAEMLSRYAESSVGGLVTLPTSYWDDYLIVVSKQISSKGYFAVNKKCALFICLG
jgi:ubiquinone/menaquinone biosynthesis C-methylase UbiE